MKKRILFLLICLSLSSFRLTAQNDNYNVFGVVIGGAFEEMPGYFKAIDTINARTTWAGDYKKSIKHFNYGFGFLHKKKFYELGGNFQWGNGSEIFVDGDDPSTTENTIYSYYVRQRTLNLNFRAGIRLGNNFSFGTEFGGMLSNFQSDKKTSTYAPLWFINFSGTRSVVGTLTPYISFHFQGESIFLEFQPYYSLCFGEVSFKDTFDPALYAPTNDIDYSSTVKYLGLRVMFGLARE